METPKPPIDHDKLRERLHYASGTYIAGKIFSEYAFGLSELFFLDYKGEKTKQTKTKEAEAHVTKFVNFIAVDLKRVGIQLGVTDNEVDNLEGIIHAMLTLEEVDQKRVMGLIKRIKKENESKAIR